jgi:hypothetical protein
MGGPMNAPTEERKLAMRSIVNATAALALAAAILAGCTSSPIHHPTASVAVTPDGSGGWTATLSYSDFRPSDVLVVHVGINGASVWDLQESSLSGSGALGSAAGTAPITSESVSVTITP